MLKASILACTLISLVASISNANAQQWRLLSAEEQAPWGAVGKLVNGRIGAQGLCTATLIAPDYILTAAHCLATAQKLTPSQLRRYTFAAGWNDGKALGTSPVAEVIIPEDYRFGRKTDLETLNSDWALARLAEPIVDVQPLPLVRLPGPWEPVYYLSYSQKHDEAPLLTKGCAHRVMEQGPLQISCPAVGGNSGAAVLVGRPESPQIVAIIAAQAQSNAFAVIPNDELISLIETLQ